MVLCRNSWTKSSEICVTSDLLLCYDHSNRENQILGAYHPDCACVCVNGCVCLSLIVVVGCNGAEWTEYVPCS